jgi:hypothetical protein
MQPIHLQATLDKDGSLTISGLPFHAGDTVELSIELQKARQEERVSQPFAGIPIEYIDPFEPVAADEWEALQ